MNRPTKEQLQRALESAARYEATLGPLRPDEDGVFTPERVLAAEVRALRDELDVLKTRYAGELNDKWWAERCESDPAYAVMRKRFDDLRTENAELRRQVVAARSALQQCTHERVDPNRDPFGGF